jgi:ribosomal protein S18 acetylase RimI-like enzyme
MAPTLAARERWKFRPALERASEVLRQESARGLWFKILGETMYRRLLLLERPLHEPILEVTARVPVVISLLKKTEIAEYAQFRTEADVSGIRSRLDAGQVCFVARYQGGLVSSSWGATNRAWIDYLSRELRLAPDEVYAYDSFTEPAFRGRSLDPARTAEKLRYFRAAGYRRMVCTVSLENRASLLSCAKVGYRPYGLIGYVQIGPRKRHFCRLRHAPTQHENAESRGDTRRPRT